MAIVSCIARFANVRITKKGRKLLKHPRFIQICVHVAVEMCGHFKTF